MEIEEIGKNLKQKIEELETIEKWYAERVTRFRLGTKVREERLRRGLRRKRKKLKNGMTIYLRLQELN